VNTLVRYSGIVAKATDSRLREPGFECCVTMANLGQVLMLYIASVHPAV